MKSKVLLIGSNPSVKSEDESAFHPSTRSRMVIDGWFKNIDAELAFINICDQRMPNNRSLTVSEIRDYVPGLIEKMDDYFDHVFVGLGKTAHKALRMANVEFFEAPHPSGLNHQLNDKEFVTDFLLRLKEYIMQNEDKSDGRRIYP